MLVEDPPALPPSLAIRLEAKVPVPTNARDGIGQKKLVESRGNTPRTVH